MGQRFVSWLGHSDVTYDYYLNDQWQTLEVRKDADVDPYEQYIWQLYYIDALLLRDYDEDVDGTSVRHYYTQDANFNVSAVIDESGTVLERYHYTPYGQLSVLDADFSADADGKSDNANAATFTGRRFDPETGLYYYRNRYYHSQLGLFISKRFCRTLENWMEGIANYLADRSSNGPTESLNQGLRAILWRAFGQRNFEHFRLRALDAYGRPRTQEST